MPRTIRKLFVLTSCVAWLGFLALTVISFVYPSVIGYGHISKTTVGKCDWFHAFIYVNGGNSGWYFGAAWNFDGDSVTGGGFHWNRTSLFPPRFDAAASKMASNGATELRAHIAFPLWIPLAVFAVLPAIWAYLRRKSRKQMAGFPVTPV